jgi:hypothetical protein
MSPRISVYKRKNIKKPIAIIGNKLCKAQPLKQMCKQVLDSCPCSDVSLFTKTQKSQTQTRIQTRTVAPSLKEESAVKKVIYIDYQLDWNNPAATIRQVADIGFNVIILAFYLTTAPADAAVAWMGLSPQTQIDTVNYLHSKAELSIMYKDVNK